jgi:hypothetical protein
MATILVTGTSIADGALTKTYNVSEADFALMMTALKAKYSKATNVLAAAAWFDETIAFLVRDVKQYNTPAPVAPAAIVVA